MFWFARLANAGGTTIAVAIEPVAMAVAIATAITAWTPEVPAAIVPAAMAVWLAAAEVAEA